MRGRRVQLRRLREHLGLERAEARTGVDAQLLGQGRACPPQGRECVRLTLRAVQGQHQEPPALLPQRVLRDQRFEVTHEHRCVAQLQTCVEQPFAGDRSELGQPDGLGLDPRLARVLGVRRTPPQAQGLLEGTHRIGGWQRRGLTHGPLEAPGVNRLRAEAEHVAGTGARDHAVPLPGSHVGLEATAQVADVGLDGAGAVGGRQVAPDPVGEACGGHDLVPADHERSQHRALAPAAEVDSPTVPRRRQLPEHLQAEPGVLHPSPHSCSVENSEITGLRKSTGTRALR